MNCLFTRQLCGCGMVSVSIRTGLDNNTAQHILQVWEKSGAQSPDELRNLLIKRSVQSAGAVLVQTVLDAGKGPKAQLCRKRCERA